MDITLNKDGSFRLKDRSGVATCWPGKFTIESIALGESKTFAGPGEFEVAGISVIGIKNEEDTIYIFEIDSIRIAYLGGTEKKIPEVKMSLVGDIDVLLLPVIPESLEILQAFESYYCIPFGYKSQEELDKFLKDSGATVERINKFSLKKEEIIEDSPTQVVVLDTK